MSAPDEDLAAEADPQSVLDVHLIKGNGRCRECDEWGPCAARRAAMDVFNDKGALPIRTPGATPAETRKDVA